ncbi:hypothetical protein JCM24511_06337 [Saitozyma sp. JCM 24511]|nr:hypothetical protein JCM24511_06337 [Saitozyma sp. JCM 24511]
MNFQHNPPAPETFIPDAFDSITDASMYSSGITPTVEYRNGHSDLTHHAGSDLMQGKLYTGTGHCCVHGCTEPSYLYFAGNPQDGKFYGVKESCATHTWAGVPQPRAGAPDESVLGWYALDGASTTNAPIVDENSQTMEWQQDPSGAFQMDTVPGVDPASMNAPTDTTGLLGPSNTLMNTSHKAHNWQDSPEEVTLQEALSTATATYAPLQPVPPTSSATYQYRKGQIAYLASKIVELNSWTPSSRGVKRASTCPTLDDAVSTSASLRQSQTWPSGAVPPAITQSAPPQTSAAGWTDVVLAHRPAPFHDEFGPAPYHDEFGPAESQL